jgi:hypothetical protein
LIKDNTQSKELEDFQSNCDDAKLQRALEKVKSLEKELRAAKAGSSPDVKTDANQKKIGDMHSHSFTVKNGQPLPFIGDHHPVHFNEDTQVEILGASEKIEEVLSLALVWPIPFSGV